MITASYRRHVVRPHKAPSHSGSIILQRFILAGSATANSPPTPVIPIRFQLIVMPISQYAHTNQIR